MDYIHYTPWFEKGDSEAAQRRKRLEHALTEFGFVLARLRCITDRLIKVRKEDLTEQNISWAVEEVGYHGDYFLNTTYEIQDRLAGLLAELTGSEKNQLIGRLNAYKDARMPRYLKLKETTPIAAKQFLALESCICSFVKLRRIKTHGATLHFEFMVDGQPCDPEEILGLAGSGAIFGSLVQIMRKEMRRFITRHENVCKQIEGRGDKLDEAIRKAGKLDD